MENMDVKKLSNKEILIKIKDLKKWHLKKDYNAIKKTFIFTDFKEAFCWMTYVSLEAEKNNHHPEWKNVYNKVEVYLSTHDVNGLSYKDFYIAKVMDFNYKKFVG